MGTWSNRPFGNDTASDWALRLVASADDGMVQEALRIESDAEIDAADAERAIAAAALVAAAAADPPQGVSNDLKSWIRQRGYTPSADLVDQARTAIDAITEDSELRDLWEESDALDGWLKATRKIGESLSAALETGLPRRSPKKPGMPRKLDKLVERYRNDPDPNVLARIREKLESLDDPNKASRETGGMRPISLLAEAGLVREMELLINRGIDISAAELASGDSPLIAACRGDQLDAVRFLVDAGMSVVEETVLDRESGCEKWEYDIDPVSWREAYEHEPDWCVFRYSQPLWYAVRFGSIELLEYLLSTGADLNQRDLNGESLLHKAASQGRIDMMSYLAERGFNVNEDSDECEAPIYQAIRNMRPEAVQWLIDNGADVNRETWIGGTPLDYAEDKPRIAEMLRSAGARPG